MILSRSHLPSTSKRPVSAIAGFTISEFLVTTCLVVLVVGVLAVVGESTGRTLLSLTSQASHNQAAGNGAEFMISRIRLANSVTNDSLGNSVTLGFDDDPDVDSNGDGMKWNDQNHFEQFQFVDTDGKLSTLDDNMIVYKANATQLTGTVLVPSSTRKLSGGPIFSVTNGTTVLINFGLLTTNASAFTQAIEIRTKAVMRNRTQ